MLAANKEYYDGIQIAMDKNINLKVEQEIILTIPDIQKSKRSKLI